MTLPSSPLAYSAHTIDCYLAYILALQEYQPANFFYPSPDNFKKLSVMLTTHEVDAYKYISFWFGMWPGKKYPSPKRLTNVELILDYKHLVSSHS